MAALFDDTEESATRILFQCEDKGFSLNLETASFQRVFVDEGTRWMLLPIRLVIRLPVGLPIKRRGAFV